MIFTHTHIVHVLCTESGLPQSDVSIECQCVGEMSARRTISSFGVLEQARIWQQKGGLADALGGHIHVCNAMVPWLINCSLGPVKLQVGWITSESLARGYAALARSQVESDARAPLCDTRPS